MDYDL